VSVGEMASLNYSLYLFFGAVAGVCAVLSLFLTETRATLLLVWLAGVSIGGCFLASGAEFLAIAQWLVSTILAIVTLFFSNLFDQSEDAPDPFFLVLGVICSVFCFFLISKYLAPAFVMSGLKFQNIPLAQIGKSLVVEHALEIQLICVICLIAAVGVGHLSRPEMDGKK